MSIQDTLKQLAEHNIKLRGQVEALTGQIQSILDQTHRAFRLKDEAINVLIGERTALKGFIKKLSEENQKLRKENEKYEIAELERSWRDDEPA